MQVLVLGWVGVWGCARPRPSACAPPRALLAARVGARQAACLGTRSLSRASWLLLADGFGVPRLTPTFFYPLAIALGLWRRRSKVP